MALVLQIIFPLVPIFIVEKVVEVVIQIVEVVIHLINILLGWEPDTQIIEYFEVENVPLFTNNDRNNPLTNVILGAIFNNDDIAGELIYASTFRDMKGNFREFMRFIENGNYFESFPGVESYIVVVDYDEIAATLLSIHGEATTTEQAKADALSDIEWVQYWLQENRIYDVGLNELGEGTASTSTSPGTPAADGFTVTPSANHFEVDITSEAVTSDSMTASQVWEVIFGSIVYNSGPDNYNVDATNGTDIITLPYTIPSKPLQMHYIVYYHVNSNPTKQLLFVYKIGEGTYPLLDDIEDPIDIPTADLQAVPAVPLRISNSNYTTFGATKAQQIEDILDIVDLDPQALLDLVLNDPDLNPGQVDNIYLNFGVRLKDTSQAGLAYLYNMCENLFAGQVATKALYDATPPGDDPPLNTMITTTDDNKAVFQWNYITFNFTTLAEIDGDTGSVENGIYYSDMSKFNSSNILEYPYFISSAKGTYNVGFKADDLTEVANFLAGSGTVNPGIVSTEGTNWLQVTTRLAYNNPSPVLLDPDNTTSTLVYLTPDRIYENNGAGVLRAVEQAALATLEGQSITYYEATIAGLIAYELVAPIGALKVIDGDTSKFRMVKFNLAGEKEIMAPMIHSFIKDQSKTSVTKLFLNGAHLSIYIADYQVIQPASLSVLEAALALVLIIVVIVVVVISLGSAGPAAAALITTLASIGLVAASILLFKLILSILIVFLLQYLLKKAVTALAKKDAALAIIVAIIGTIAIAAYSSGGLGDMTTLDMALAGISIVDNVTMVFEVRTAELEENLETDQASFDREAEERKDIFYTQVDALAEVQEEVFGVGSVPLGTFDLMNNSLRAQPNSMYAEHLYTLNESYTEIPFMLYEIEPLMDAQVSTEAAFI